MLCLSRSFVPTVDTCDRTPLMFNIHVFEENDVALGGENERRRANLSLLFSLIRVMIDNNRRIVERTVSRFVAFDRLFVNDRRIVIPIIIFFFPVL